MSSTANDKTIYYVFGYSDCTPEEFDSYYIKKLEESIDKPCILVCLARPYGLERYLAHFLQEKNGFSVKVTAGVAVFYKGESDQLDRILMRIESSSTEEERENAMIAVSTHDIYYLRTKQENQKIMGFMYNEDEQIRIIKNIAKRYKIEFKPQGPVNLMRPLSNEINSSRQARLEKADR